MASVSDIRWYLGGQCTALTGGAGIDDAVGFDPQGATVTYHVYGDGELLWETGVMRRAELATFELDVTGVRDLTLHVSDGGDHTYNDRANWVNLAVTCS